MSAAAVRIPTRVKILPASARVAAREALQAGSPKSVLSIPYVVPHSVRPWSDDDDDNDTDDKTKNWSPGAVIAQVGSARHISILNPYLTSEEMHGLAHRITVLARNESLNSILLSNNVNHRAEDIALPESALDVEKQTHSILSDVNAPGHGQVYHALGGYDARALHHAPPAEKQATLAALSALTLSVKGGADVEGEYHSKIPFVSIPHGIVTDGGYALAMGSYVLATADSRFRVENPLRGLSLDPVGLSFVLPRLGWEFGQVSADYPVGKVLALTGFEADASDMVETGMATHYIDSFGKVGPLERALSQFAPYEQQRLRKDPITCYGEEKKVDVNKNFRNVAVASLLDNVSVYDAAGHELIDLNYMYKHQMDEDPTFVLDSEKADFCRDRESALLDIAATFQDAFEEDSMEGILERVKEFASKQPSDEEESEIVHTAKDMLTAIEAQSPLALQAVYRLMEEGSKKSATIEECMERERKVQLKLLEEEDFINWAKSGAEAGDFVGWKHKSVADVSPDEVDELLG